MTKPHKHRDVIIAWADGAEIETLTAHGWKTCTDPDWCNSEYRVKDPYRKLKEAQAAGKTIQCLNDTGWSDCSPTFMFPPENYRIKPEPTTQKVKLLAYFNGTNLFWRVECLITSPEWKRVPSEDKEIEVEL